MMKKLEFTPRDILTAYEWDAGTKHWNRPELDREILKKLSERSTLNGLLRVGLFVFLLGGSAAAAIYTSRYSLLLAIPLF